MYLVTLYNISTAVHLLYIFLLLLLKIIKVNVTHATDGRSKSYKSYRDDCNIEITSQKGHGHADPCWRCFGTDEFEHVREWVNRWFVFYTSPIGRAHLCEPAIIYEYTYTIATPILKLHMINWITETFVWPGPVCRLVSWSVRWSVGRSVARYVCHWCLHSLPFFWNFLEIFEREDPPISQWENRVRPAVGPLKLSAVLTLVARLIGTLSKFNFEKMAKDLPFRNEKIECVLLGPLKLNFETGNEWCGACIRCLVYGIFSKFYF